MATDKYKKLLAEMKKKNESNKQDVDTSNISPGVKKIIQEGYIMAENDPDYGELAYRTAKPISPTNLGITGSLTQGIDSKMFNRF